MKRALPLVCLASAACLPMLQDPAPGFFTSHEDARKLVCARTTFEAVRRADPGRLDEPRPRGDFADRDLVRCETKLLDDARRDPQDRAILAGLDADAAQLAQRVRSTAPPGRTWLVEAHYPNPAVASKIAFAAKAALVERGLTVTDRAPVLAVGDLDVLSRTPPLEAHPLACRRYYAPGRLEDPDAVLALVVLDRRETLLHAATCVNGRWSWLQ